MSWKDLFQAHLNELKKILDESQNDEELKAKGLLEELRFQLRFIAEDGEKKTEVLN